MKYIVSILMIAIIFLSTIVFKKSQENRILSNQLKSYIDNSSFKNELLGRWIEITYVGDTFIYQFNQDNTWVLTSIEKSGKKLVRKGEYQIGKEKGVFLRQYGSQHWFHDTTYIDIKSGIGTDYLFVKDRILINNQEDYESKYRKQK